MATYDFYCDSGHGWLKVTRKELFSLGIIDKISSFSYCKGEYVYLEEDCDAPLFIEAKKEDNEDIKFRTHHTDKKSKIRGYDRF